MVFVRSYADRVYRVYYNTTNDSDLSTWRYATFSGTPLANTVKVTGLAPNAEYFFKVRVTSAMGATIVDSDVWKLSTLSGEMGIYARSFVPIGASIDSPVTLNVPFVNDAGSSQVLVTVPAAVSQTISSIEVESRQLNGDTALTIDVRDANGQKVTSVAEPLTFILPYDSVVTPETLSLSYTHNGETFDVKRVPDQSTISEALGQDGFYWRENTNQTFIFCAQKFSTLAQYASPINIVPASSPVSLTMFIVGAASLLFYEVWKSKRTDYSE